MVSDTLYIQTLTPENYSKIGIEIGKNLAEYSKQTLSDEFSLKSLYSNEDYQILAVGLGGLSATGDDAVRILAALGLEDWAAAGIARLAGVFTRYYNTGYTLAFGQSDKLRIYRDLYMQGMAASGVGWYLLSQYPQITGLDKILERLYSPSRATEQQSIGYSYATSSTYSTYDNLNSTTTTQPPNPIAGVLSNPIIT